MKRKENFKLPPGWPVRDGTFARWGKLGAVITLLFCLAFAAISFAADRPVEKAVQNDPTLSTSNRLPDGMVINRIARPPRPAISPDMISAMLSAKKPEGWVPMAAAQAQTPYNLDWYSFNSGGITFGFGGPLRLGGTIGQSVAGEGASGSNRLGIGFWYGTDPACTVSCPPGAVAEGEACTQGVDNFNGGCNSSPEVYSPINCADTVCGTAWADTNFRDTDWYLHTFTSSVSLSWSVVAEFPTLLAIVDLSAGCITGVPAIGSFAACDTGRLTADLPAGTYAFFVATNDFDGYACVDGPHDYVGWLDCCVECPPSGIAEGEACGSDINGGCNSGPPVFSPINLGDTVCGTAWADTSFRDTDWYQKVLTESTVVRWCAVGEFPILIGIIDGNSGCPVFAFRKFGFADSCDTATVIDTLPPGTWWFFAATQGFNGYPCVSGPHNYTAWLTEGCLRIKGDMNGDGIYTAADVVMMLNCAFLGIGFCDPCFADVNCDGVLTAADVVLELNRAFLGITAPPWCGP